MSEKIGKMKPDKIRKRIVIPLDERKGYAEMIKYENANLKTINIEYKKLHGCDIPRSKYFQIKE
tara:strand:- start:126 stop:317 length:192 start_codon:yes stop_codon:yes gene_type:complete